MVGLYRPKILLIKTPGSEFLEKLLSDGEVSLFKVENIQDAQDQLAQVNFDAIVALIDRKNNKIPEFFKMISANISILIVEDQKGGVVPEIWRHDVFLKKKTAQESLIKICTDLMTWKKRSKKAA